jgi:hypothetical protein
MFLARFPWRLHKPWWGGANGALRRPFRCCWCSWRQWRLVQVGRGGRPSREPLSLLQKEGLERSLAFKRLARGRCFRCLECGYQVNSCRLPFKCIRCHRPGYWEWFCRACFPTGRSRSPNASAPFQWSRYPHRPSVSRSWAEVVGRSSPAAKSQPRPSPKCCEEFNVNDSFDSNMQCQFACLRSLLSWLLTASRRCLAPFVKRWCNNPNF